MPPAVFLIILCAACFFALWKGGTPERLVAGIFLTGAALSMMFRFSYQSSFGAINIGVWIADIAVLLALTAVALNAERYWTIWIASFQWVQVVSHLPELLIPELLPRAHWVIISLWVYPMLIILVIGTWRHVNRTEVHGTDRSWSDFSQLQG
jgi:hypothetical protein